MEESIKRSKSGGVSQEKSSGVSQEKSGGFFQRMKSGEERRTRFPKNPSRSLREKQREPAYIGVGGVEF